MKWINIEYGNGCFLRLSKTLVILIGENYSQTNQKYHIYIFGKLFKEEFKDREKAKIRTVELAEIELKTAMENFKKFKLGEGL